MALTQNRENYYQALGIDPDATQRQIKAAYRRRVRETHPDRLGSQGETDAFKRVQRAYEVLSRPLERARYDIIMGLGPQGSRYPVYRRSFDTLFESLFRGLRSTLSSHAHAHRRAG